MGADMGGAGALDAGGGVGDGRSHLELSREEQVERSERLLEQYRQLVLAEHATREARGELICQAVQENANRLTRNRVYASFAAIERCSTNMIRYLAEVYAAYTQEQRLQLHEHGVSWSVKRATYQAARRLGRATWDVMQEALEHGWHVAELSQLGLTKRTVYTLRTVCGGCGYRVSVRGAAPTAPLPCPVCLKRAMEDSRVRNLQDVLAIDVLGAVA